MGSDPAEGGLVRPFGEALSCDFAYYIVQRKGPRIRRRLRRSSNGCRRKWSVIGLSGDERLLICGYSVGSSVRSIFLHGLCLICRAGAEFSYCCEYCAP